MDNPYQAPEADLTPSTTLEDGVLDLATRKRRWVGAMLDTLFTAVPGIAIAYAIGLYDNISPSGQLPILDQLMASMLAYGVFMILNGLLIYKQGQTVGKYICKTRVVSLDGTQISGNIYLFRRLVPIWGVAQLPLVGSLLVTVDALFIFRNNRNCLHDDIAKTRVINI